MRKKVTRDIEGVPVAMQELTPMQVLRFIPILSAVIAFKGRDTDLLTALGETHAKTFLDILFECSELPNGQNMETIGGSTTMDLIEMFIEVNTVFFSRLQTASGSAKEGIPGMHQPHQGKQKNR